MLPPPTPKRPQPLAAAAALVTIYLVWGSTYLAIAVVVQTLPPLLAAGVRFLVAGVLLLAWCAWRGTLWRARPTLGQWGAAAVVGGLLLLGGNGFVMLAEQRIPSGVTALLVGIVPIWIALLDALVNRHGVSKLVVFGLLAGLAGLAVLVVPASDLSAIDPLGAGMVVVASLSWAAGSLYARGDRLPSAQLVATGMEMLAGGVLMTLAGMGIGELGRLDPATFSAASLLALLYLVVIGSLVGFTVYIWLLQNLPTSTVATYAYVNPVVAVLLGWLFLREEVTIRTLIAAAVIIGAVVAMIRGRPQAETEPQPEPDRVVDDTAAAPAVHNPAVPETRAGGAPRTDPVLDRSA